VRRDAAPHAGRLQQRQPAGGRPPEPGEHACTRSGWRGQRLLDRRRHQRAGHRPAADLLERGHEAQAERLADRLEGHVGGDAVAHHHDISARKAGTPKRWIENTTATTATGSSRAARIMPADHRRLLESRHAFAARVWMVVLGARRTAAAESPLVQRGQALRHADSASLHIKGISLGNWLMPEGYMFKFEVAKSPRQIYGAFERLLGRERAGRSGTQYPRALHRRGRHPVHQVGRLQHRAHPAALAPVHGRRR
jgi:hypothetical protein